MEAEIKRCEGFEEQAEQENLDHLEKDSEDLVEKMYDFVRKHIKKEFAKRNLKTWLIKNPDRLNYRVTRSYVHKDLDYRKESLENELKKERVLSENELRVKRSLEKLNIPDWYKNHPGLPQGFLLKRNSEAGVESNKSPTHYHWPGLSSETTILSDFESVRSNQRNTPECSIGASISPTLNQLSRWSSSKSNSSSSISPSHNDKSSFNYRQPYLGWRYTSQERLAKPTTPSERLAASLLQDVTRSSNFNNDVGTSIRKVTSPIEQYISAKESSADRLYSSQHYFNDSPKLSSSVSHKARTGRFEKHWLDGLVIGSEPLCLSSPEISNMRSEVSLKRNDSFPDEESIKIHGNSISEPTKTYSADS